MASRPHRRHRTGDGEGRASARSNSLVATMRSHGTRGGHTGGASGRHDDHMTTDQARRPSRFANVRTFVPVTLFTPLLGASLGIDGGPIFQILAVEDLGLSPATIGIAFGLGIVSLPVQLYASRIPLHRARRNVQLFLLVAALQTWILAILVATGTTGPVANTALAVTVTAEVALSVLFATAWQPLLSWSLDTTSRQRLNTTWPAIARGLLAGLVVVFASLDGTGRAWFLAAAGAVATLCAISLQRVPDPPRPPDDGPDSVDGPNPARRPLSKHTRTLLVVFGTVNIGALPLWLVYLDQALWPTANLGLVAGIQTAASMVALLAWRPTDGDVTIRAFVAAVVLLVAVVTIAFVPGPITSTVGQAVVLLATAVIGASVTTVRVATLEAAHRTVHEANSVRAFTVIDVVASTSLQAGLLAGGLLITVSESSTWPVDPYLTFVLAGSIAGVAATWRSCGVRPISS